MRHNESDMTVTTDWHAFNAGVVEDFRAHQGTISVGRFAGRKLLLLTTTGAKSGQERIAPLAFTGDGEHYVVIASKGGSPTSPDSRSPIASCASTAPRRLAKALSK